MVQKRLNRISSKFIIVFVLLCISLLGSVFSAIYVTNVQKQHIVLTEALYEMRLIVEEVTQTSQHFNELRAYHDSTLAEKEEDFAEIQSSIDRVKKMYENLYSLVFPLEDGSVLVLEFDQEFEEPFINAVREANDTWIEVEKGIIELSKKDAVNSDELMAAMKRDKEISELMIANNNELMSVCRAAAEKSKQISDIIQVVSLITGVIIFLFVMIYMFTGVYRPVIYIRDTFKKMSKGDLTLRFNRKADDEFTMLFNDFNVFLNSLETIFDLENKVVQEQSLENILILLNDRLKQFIDYDVIGVVYKNYQGNCTEIVIRDNELQSEVCLVHQKSYETITMEDDRLIIPVKLQGTLLGYYYFTNIKDETTKKAFIRLIKDKLNIAFYKNVLVKELLSIIIETLSETAEAKDPETYNHLVRMSSYSQIIAKELRRQGKYKNVITGEFIDTIKITAPMHDIGKISIKDEILLKPGRLTDEEFAIMKTHAANGGKLLSNLNDKMAYYGINYFEMASTIAYEHQEKYDGRGYPKGLKGNNISLVARIVALADVFDALTSKRPYKDAFSLEKSYEIINESKGSHFDPEVVEAFFKAQKEIEQVYYEYREI